MHYLSVMLELELFETGTGIPVLGNSEALTEIPISTDKGSESEPKLINIMTLCIAYNRK